jgi:hypothetical protein
VAVAVVVKMLTEQMVVQVVGVLLVKAEQRLLLAAQELLVKVMLVVLVGLETTHT